MRKLLFVVDMGFGCFVVAALLHLLQRTAATAAGVQVAINILIHISIKSRELNIDTTINHHHLSTHSHTLTLAIAPANDTIAPLNLVAHAANKTLHPTTPSLFSRG